MTTRQRVAITGAGGFVGKHLVARLVNDGHEVHAIVRDPADAPADAEGHVVPSLSHSKIASVLAEIDVIVHLAWATTPSASRGQPLLELEGNLLPSAQLVNLLQDSPVSRILFVSSSGAVTRATDQEFVAEGTPMPFSYYGAAKVAVEQFLLALASQYGKSCLVLRPTNLYGPLQPLIPGFGLIRTIVDCLMRDRPLTVWGDGSTQKDFLYIHDFLDLLQQLVQADDLEGSAVLEVGSGHNYSIAKVIEMLEAISGRTLRQLHAPARSIDTPKVAIDVEPLRQLTGWSPKTSLEEGLQAVYAWAKNEYDR